MFPPTSGSIMLDVTGFNWNSSVTIPGLHKAALDAYNSNKPTYLIGLNDAYNSMTFAACPITLGRYANGEKVYFIISNVYPRGPCTLTVDTSDKLESA